MQVSSVLRRYLGGYSHWCPGCEEMHVISDDWSFNGNLDQPTFYPSIKVTGKETIKENGQWIGGWVRDAEGNALDSCCHYFIVDGRIQFCSDSTHKLAGLTVPIPELPSWLTDANSFDAEIIEETIAQDDQRGPVNFSTGVAELCKAKAG